MPLTITLTIPDADVPRLQAALTAGGQQPKQALQAFLVSLVQGPGAGRGSGGPPDDR